MEVSWQFSASSSVIFLKWPFAIASHFSPFLQKQSFNFSDVRHIHVRRTIAYLCLNMIDFVVVDFSERRSEEVISFFWRSVYIGDLDMALHILHEKHKYQITLSLCLISIWQPRSVASGNLLNSERKGGNKICLYLDVEFKALFNNVFTLKNLSCMSLHAISVLDKVNKWSPQKITPQKHH